jgi:hypothetical protein
MKFLNKKLFVTLGLLNTVSYLVGYTYDLVNATNKTLVVRLVERKTNIVSNDKSDQYIKIQPGDQKSMKLPGMWCLKSIQARSFDKETDVPSDLNKLALADVTIKMESNVNKNTGDVSNTEKASAENKAQDDQVSDEIKEAVTVLHEESLCRDRMFTFTFTGKKAQKVIGDKVYTLPFDEIVAITLKG